MHQKDECYLSNVSAERIVGREILLMNGSVSRPFLDGRKLVLGEVDHEAGGCPAGVGEGPQHHRHQEAHERAGPAPQRWILCST